MGTCFEAALWGGDAVRLEAIAREALDQVCRLDRQLSRFNPQSDVYELNLIASRRSVRVEPRLFRLLDRAVCLSEETEGAFDPTVGPLMELWAFREGGRVPSNEEIAQTLGQVGARHLALDPDASTVAFRREGLQLDLGAVGKGHAIETAAEILAEYDLPGFLLHGGSSTVYARGTTPSGEPWRVRIAAPTGVDEPLPVVALDGQALSVSAPHGRQFERDGRTLGHVLDPRTGRPVAGAKLAAVVCPSATESDALSTALLVGGVLPVRTLAPTEGASCLVIAEDTRLVGPAFV